MHRTSLLVTLRILSSAAGFACCLQVGFAAPSNTAGDVSTATLSPDAGQLVQAALDAEAAGDAAKRSALLAAAVKADPEFAPARWHSGQIKFDGRWRTTADVRELVSKDPRWAGYRELRASLGRTINDHLALAEYCRDRDLTDEGRYHWAHVLLAAPNNRAARQALGLQKFRGGLFTRELVAKFEQADKDAEANREQFGPQMMQLCRDATSGEESRRNVALAAIRKLSDDAVIEPLELAATKASKRTPRLAEPLQLAVVAALGRMPQHAATLRLLNHAVYADSPEVRKLAAEGLKSRPQTDYVPLLVAALRAPIEGEFTILTGADGSVRMSETLVQQGAETDRSHVRNTNYLTEGAVGFDRSRSNPAAVLERNLTDAEAAVADTQAEVDAANADAKKLNKRIEEALRIATSAEIKDDNPEQWWVEWQAVNELQSSGEDATVSTFEESTQTYYYPQAPVYYLRSPEQKKETLTPRPEPRRPVVPKPVDMRPGVRYWRTPEYMAMLRRSCFVPGTPVWTQAGPRSIEEIAPGDMVLAQSPYTAELAFRPVLATTVGPPTGVVNLTIGDERIGSTLGHRFWVNGRGWEMAKFLEPSTQLHALGGAVEVTSVETGERVDCYNLEVDEFHTFFVGEAKILVHDKTCPAPVLSRVPGSTAIREFRLHAWSTSAELAR